MTAGKPPLDKAKHRWMLGQHSAALLWERLAYVASYYCFLGVARASGCSPLGLKAGCASVMQNTRNAIPRTDTFVYQRDYVTSLLLTPLVRKWLFGLSC